MNKDDYLEGQLARKYRMRLLVFERPRDTDFRMILKAGEPVGINAVIGDLKEEYDFISVRVGQYVSRNDIGTTFKEDGVYPLEDGRNLQGYKYTSIDPMAPDVEILRYMAVDDTRKVVWSGLAYNDDEVGD